MYLNYLKQSRYYEARKPRRFQGTYSTWSQPVQLLFFFLTLSSISTWTHYFFGLPLIHQHQPGLYQCPAGVGMLLYLFTQPWWATAWVLWSVLGDTVLKTQIMEHVQRKGARLVRDYVIQGAAEGVGFTLEKKRYLKGDNSYHNEAGARVPQVTEWQSTEEKLKYILQPFELCLDSIQGGRHCVSQVAAHTQTH